MKEFTNLWFENVGDKVKELLQEYSAKLGFELQIGKISYIPGLEFTVQLQFQKKATDDSDPQKDNWNQWCEAYGLKPDMYGKTICIKGKNLRIAGLNRTARTRVVDLIGVDDHRQYNMDAESLKSVMGIGGKESYEDEKREWEMSAFLYGLKGVPFGAVFHYHGESYKIAGINHRAREYKILAEKVSDGKRYKFKPSDVIKGLKS